ncbi:MAG: acetate/propionate family kinase [Deltaproteobacteria bacterium]|nr:acetate/propionate family kinase [Deltaproteobacteria bacterium]
MIVLTLQASASMLEYRLWDMVGERTLVDGVVSGVGSTPRHRYNYWFGSGQGTSRASDSREAFQRAWEALWIALPSIERVEGLLPRVEGVGHVMPFVPPGDVTSARIDDDLLEFIKNGPPSVEGDPGRGFAALNVMEEARHVMPEAVHVGVFDDLALLAATAESACYPVRPPWVGEHMVARLRSGGVRIRGVLDSAMDVVGDVENNPRILICDLDDVPQVSSLKARSLIETTHEFDGTSRLMSVRGPGAVSPGLRDALLRAGAPDGGEVDDLLQRRSGLACIEETPLTVYDLASMAENQIYGAASRMFFDQLVREIGGQITLLGGLDILVFTGRWGFESHALRSMIAARLRLFRIAIDEGLNRSVQGPADIATVDGRVRIVVVPPASLWQVALETAHMLSDDV